MKKVRIVPMAAEHLNEVAALELACFSRPWSRQMLAEELDNQCAATPCLRREGSTATLVIYPSSAATNSPA